MNPWNVWLQHKTSFLRTINSIIHCTNWTKNVDDDFTEDVRTFLISNLPSLLDKYFSGASTILISNGLFIQVSWWEELSLFLPELLPKLKNHFAHLIIRMIFFIWGIHVFTNMIHMWRWFIVVEIKITMIPEIQNYLVSLIINPKWCFSGN